jgi:hypothetical protein
MTDVAELLDAIVPAHEGTGDWSRVLRDADADRRPRRMPVRLGAVFAVAAATAGIVALWPAGGGGEPVLDRALAAAGQGEVLHLVYESGLPRTLVDLETGKRTEILAQHEVWFDPRNGLRETERFEGVVQFDISLGPEEVSEHAGSLYMSLGAGYREALESGRADVLGEDVVEATPVYWIRIEAGHDVAVSQETYEPVYVRVSQAGVPALDRILSYETVEAGSAPLDAEGPGGPPNERVAVAGDEIELDGASALLGREAVWAGASLHGFSLDAVRELLVPSAGGDVRGVSLAYGSTQTGPHVEISQAASLADGLTMLAGVRGYAPPEGTALLAGPTAMLRSNGLVVVIHAPDEAMAVDVARLLEPYSG